MFLENVYINFNKELEINTIYSYKIIMNKFINKYIEINDINYLNKQLLINDAILYSKYYLYYKIFNCVYDEKIMNILYDIEFL